MKPKLTAWLLAAFIVFSAAWSVPDHTRLTRQAGDSVIFIAGISDRSTNGSPDRKWKPQRLPSVFSTLDAAAQALPGFDRSLYQRPPPVSSLSRA